MNANEEYILECCGVNIESTLERFGNDERFYMDCFRAFRDDPTMEELKAAVSSKDWESAFTAAHALKGLSGNLGLIPLFHAAAQLIVMIRDKEIERIPQYYFTVEEQYGEVIAAMKRCCIMEGRT